MRFVIKTSVSHIEERFAQGYVSGVGKDAVFSSYSMGWFVGFDGSHELLHLGMDKPKLHLGDKIKITIERINNAAEDINPI